MRFNKVNNLTGWAVCLIACSVYLLTMERTASFWDCGEFIASCYKLQIPHPPGAPLFVMMGRFFIILFGSNPTTAAMAVNAMSALASGFTILFLFWSITHFARKIVQTDNQPLTRLQIFSIMSSGVVGALAYTFSDSFWFSAVEGEVYASSSLFTAIVFWAVLKWERQADKAGSDRWIVFIFFTIGLSLGVHLLNVLTIPAIVMVYYFERFKVTTKNTIIALMVAAVVTLFVQSFVVQTVTKMSGRFDVYFANTLGLPIFTGFAFFFLLVAIGLTLLIRYANKKKYAQLRMFAWCGVFLLFGYSTYVTTMIRSNANPGVDMFNVDNPVSLAGYLGREQYNDWPILYGPDFTDRPEYVVKGVDYVKAGDKYAEAGKRRKEDWANTPSSHLFPRMWNSSNDRQQLECYRRFTGLEEGEAPTMGDNIKYFANYQAGWMYWRYFMWNFAGRQNDLQGYGNARDSNWVSGISFIDNMLYGPQDQMPDSIHQGNKAYNKLYMLPLALGVMGLLFQFKRNKRDFLVNTLLFLATGIAIVFFLNQSGFEPRERDYAYVGSFYAFSIWIGLGVLYVQSLLQKRLRPAAAAYTAAGLCILVPALMCQQEWDDHDRSKKTLALDAARNYLQSCPPNAVLFTAEDNDTYPLWYAQEVEGIRPDVRVMVNTIFAGDWCINQFRYKINESAPIDVLFTPEQIRGSNREVVYVDERMPGFAANTEHDLYSVLKNVVGSEDPRYTRETEEGEIIHMLPGRSFSIPVDADKVRRNGWAQAGDTIVNTLHVDLAGKNYLVRNDLVMLAVIAANKWERPVCFTSPNLAEDLGLGKYVRQEGMIYQLSPVTGNRVNTSKSYDIVMNRFAFNNTKGTYYDETNRNRLNNFRLGYAEIATALAQEGRYDEARKVLQRYDMIVNEKDFSYGTTSNRGNQHNAISMQFLQACYAANDAALAKKVSDSVKKDLQQQLRYYHALGNTSMTDEQLAAAAYSLLNGRESELSNRQASFAYDILSSFQMLRQLHDWETQTRKG
ncbi:MAG: DUF2723 domain-containing protein [Chitinophagaceae bacterium]